MGRELRELRYTVGSLRSPWWVKDAIPRSGLNSGGCVTSRPVRRSAPLGPAGESVPHNALRGTAGALGAKSGAPPTMHCGQAGMAAVGAVSPLWPRRVPRVSPGWSLVG